MTGPNEIICRPSPPWTAISHERNTRSPTALLDRFDETGMTPRHHAARSEHLDAMDLLIRLGADVNAHDESTIGNTPLAEVAGNCSLAVAQKLVAAGADPTLRGWMQLNALDRASKRQRGDGPAVYELLRAWSASKP